MSLVVRHAVVADAEPIGTIHVEAWQWAYRGLVPDELLDGLDRAARIEEWRQRIEAPERVSEFRVAERSGSVVGFVVSAAARDEDAGADAGEVHALYLDPRHVRTGAGRALFGAALDALAAAGHDRVVVWVLATNVRGRAFYERCGMQLDGATKSDLGLEHVRYAMPLRAVAS